MSVKNWCINENILFNEYLQHGIIKMLQQDLIGEITGIK